ncbi:hypothetical protein D3C80_1195470 [compost metagenome]
MLLYISKLKNSEVQIINNTDDSGINRPEYFDITVHKEGIKWVFKLHWRAGDAYLQHKKDLTSIGLIEINNKYDADFSLFSSERRKGIKIFEQEIIEKLRKMNIPECDTVVKRSLSPKR